MGRDPNGLDASTVTVGTAIQDATDMLYYPWEQRQMEICHSCLTFNTFIRVFKIFLHCGQHGGSLRYTAGTDIGMLVES